MKNLIVIDTFGECACACVANIYDGTDSIIIMFETGNYTRPQIEISYNDTTTVADLEIVNGFAIFKFPYSIFDTTKTCNFRYIDGEKIGLQFTISSLFGGTVPPNRTLKVYKWSDYEFKIIFVAVKTANPNDFDVPEDGESGYELSLKTPINVSVTTNSDDQVTNVDFEYKNNEHKSFSVEWDPSTGKITKFGHLPIKWE